MAIWPIDPSETSAEALISIPLSIPLDSSPIPEERYSQPARRALLRSCYSTGRLATVGPMKLEWLAVLAVFLMGLAPLLNLLRGAGSPRSAWRVVAAGSVLALAA